MSAIDQSTIDERPLAEIKGTRKRGHSGELKGVRHEKTTRGKRDHKPQAGRQKAT